MVQTTTLMTTILMGLFMGWLLSITWNEVGTGVLAQIGSGLIGAGAAVGLFILLVDAPLGWLGAALISALGAVTLSIIVNVIMVIARHMTNRSEQSSLSEQPQAI